MAGDIPAYRWADLDIRPARSDVQYVPSSPRSPAEPALVYDANPSDGALFALELVFLRLRRTFCASLPYN